MIAPVINTDYKVWETEGGGGDDLTADLDVVYSYGTEGPYYELTNENAKKGWLTLLQARGYGVKIYSPIDYPAEDQDSIDEFGYIQKVLDQRYAQDFTKGKLAVESWLDQEKQPRTKLNKINLVANKCGSLMMAFLNLDVGDLIHAKEDKTGIDEYEYIQGVQFSITPGGLMKFSWIVKAMLCLALGLTAVSCEFAGGAATDGINYGYLPKISNLQQRSWAAQIYLHADPPGNRNIIMGTFVTAGGGGYDISIVSGRKLRFWQGQSTADGIWDTPAASIPLNTWTDILITRDISTPTNPPIIYIDGTSVTLTQVQAPVGDVADETGASFVVGNLHGDYDYPFDGEIKDVRVYEVILTQAEATALDAGTNVTRGLVFHAPNVRTREIDDWEDKTLTAADRLIDNMYGVVGTPHGSPICRLIP
jgi:hypothetical protein